MTVVEGMIEEMTEEEVTETEEEKLAVDEMEKIMIEKKEEMIDIECNKDNMKKHITVVMQAMSMKLAKILKTPMKEAEEKDDTDLHYYI